MASLANKIKTIKAVSLISGGLDSLLATKVIMEQGIYVEAINFFSGFFGDLPQDLAKSVHKRKKSNLDLPSFDACWIAEKLGIKLNIVNVVEEYKQTFFYPKYGYGAHLNPCLDCKLFMVNQTIGWMRQNGFDFVISGEVIGQRPMSQRKDTMPIVAANADERLLRPLCAKLLPPTLPEKEGWVKRELLYDFNGRSRKPQIELAKKFGFNDFPQPAGGCILTDKAFADRMRDFLQHGANKDYTFDDVVLLKLGRHLRPKNTFKLIIGHDEEENHFLRERYSNQYSYMQSQNFGGALVLIVGDLVDSDVEFVAKIAARFSQGKLAEHVEISYVKVNGDVMKLSVKPFSINEIDPNWYIYS